MPQGVGSLYGFGKIQGETRSELEANLQLDGGVRGNQRLFRGLVGRDGLRPGTQALAESDTTEWRHSAGVFI